MNRKINHGPVLEREMGLDETEGGGETVLWPIKAEHSLHSSRAGPLDMARIMGNWSMAETATLTWLESHPQRALLRSLQDPFPLCLLEQRVLRLSCWYGKRAL